MPPDETAVETLLSLAEEYTGHSKTIAAQGKESVKGAHDDNALTAAEADLRVCRVNSLAIKHD
jgi:hypothetical protein